MLNPSEYALLREACKLLPKGPDYRINDYVKNLLLTVLDFQLRVAAVDSAIAHYNNNHGTTTGSHKELCQFLERHPNTQAGNETAAKELWNNRCWTRIEFLRALIAFFDAEGVRDMETLRAWAKRADFNKDVKGKIRSKHHSVGIALYQWLRLRVGIEAVKADVHVKRFVQKQIGRLPNEVETEEALVKIADELGYEPRELDATIWHVESGRPFPEAPTITSA